MHARVRPDHADQIISYDPAHKKQIMNWLHMNMMDDCVFRTGGGCAVDDQGYYRWRLALHPDDHRILFDRESDAQIFRLTWS